MKIKKILPALVLFLVNFIYVRATYFPQNVEDGFLWLFKYLPEGLRSQDSVAVIYFKFLLFVFVFAVVFEALKKSMHAKSDRITGAVAFVISLGSVIFMQDHWVLWIISTYSVIVIIILLLLPLVLLYMFGKWVFPNIDIKNHWARAGMWVVAGIILGILGTWIEASSNNPNAQFLGRALSVLALICIAVGLLQLIFASVDTFRNGGGRSSSDSSSGGSSGGSSSGRTGSGGGDDWTPADVTNRINDIQRMFDQYNRLYPQFVETLRRGNQINHDNNVAGLGIDNRTENGLGEAFELSVNQHMRLDGWMQRMIDDINAIFGMRAFGQLGNRDARRYADLVAALLQAQARTAAIFAQADALYATGDVLP